MRGWDLNLSIQAGKSARQTILRLSYEHLGVPEKVAERKARVTVNKDHAGAKNPALGGACIPVILLPMAKGRAARRGHRDRRCGEPWACSSHRSSITSREEEASRVKMTNASAPGRQVTVCKLRGPEANVKL